MRLYLRLAAMAAGLAACVPLHYLWKLFGARSIWPQVYLAYSARCLGLRIRMEGLPLKSHVLFVSNHVTWLDIFALGGATGAVFVSRDDVERWPVMGWLAGLNDTIYVARQARREVHGQADALRRALLAGRAVALFPEGTTEGGHVVLPFRPTLLASLFPALPSVQVQPVAIDYGDDAEEIAWIGAEPAGENVKRVVGRRGTIAVTLRFLQPVDPHRAGDRKTLATWAQAEVEAGLGASELPSPTLYAAR